MSAPISRLAPDRPPVEVIHNASGQKMQNIFLIDFRHPTEPTAPEKSHRQHQKALEAHCCRIVAMLA
jgi:hypothetical protein